MFALSQRGFLCSSRTARPIAQRRLPPETTLHGAGDSASLAAARALRQQLISAIEELRPPPTTAPEHRTGRAAELLRLRYVVGLPVKQVCERLGISPPHYYRQHNLAIEALAALFSSVPEADDGAVADATRHAAAEANDTGRTVPAREDTDPAPPAAVRRGMHWLPARTPLVGRTDELAFLAAQYQAAAAGSGRLVLLRGPAGVGKTRLIEELAGQARRQGAVFLEGRYVREGATPYMAWIEALRPAIAAFKEDDLRFAVGPVLADLAELFPELAALAGSSGGPAGGAPVRALTPDERRLRLFDGLAGLLRSLARRTPVVLLLDDLQWAPSLTILTYVARGLADSAVLTVGAYRDHDVIDQPHVLREVADLRRLRQTAALTLTPLSEQETEQLVGHFFGAEPASVLCPPVYRRTRGNPFFIEEVLRSLAEQGKVAPAADEWEVKDVAGIGIPESVYAVIGERTARLGDNAPEILEQASVLGMEFPLHVLSSLTEAPNDRLGPVIERAVAARLLLDRSTPEEERYAFADDQVQEALYDALPSPRRRRYHQRAGKVLESHFAGRLDHGLEELARHFAAAGDSERAAVYAMQAGRKAERLFVWPQAHTYYASALGTLDALGGHEAQRAELCELLGALCYTSGIEGAKAGEFLGRALTLHEAAGNNQRAAGVHAMIGLAYLAGSHYAARRTDLAADHLGRACTLLASGPPTPALATAQARLAIAQLALVEVQAGRQSAELAAALAARLGDPSALAEAWTALGSALVWAGAVEDGLAMLERAWLLVEGQPLPLPVQRDALALNGIILAACLKEPHLGKLWADRVAGAEQQTAMGRLWAPRYLVDVHALSGEHAAAERLLMSLRDQWAGLGEPEFAQQRAAMGLLLLRRGEWDQARTLLEAAHQWGGASHYAWFVMTTELRLGELFIETGAFAAAQEQLRVALTTARAGGCVLVELSILAALARAETSLCQFDAAELHIAEAYALLRRGGSWGGLYGDVALAEAVTQAAQGRRREADTCFAQAAAAFQQRRLLWDEAKVSYEWGCSLVRASRLPDGVPGENVERKTRAGTLLGKALEMWETMGARPLAEKCRQQMSLTNKGDW
ncbi:MAG: AAA family ATPase [Chloroflexi bacterium]|nr:AAA family ATPase [Chloroflexota bacterium]